MLTLINTNRMMPPIAPVGLDYVGEAVREAGWEVELVDLALAEDADAELDRRLRASRPELVGLSFRNVDDCFWPSAQSFLPVLQRDVAAVRRRTDAPLVLGGVGFSILAQAIVARTGADFGIRGDGERATVALLRELRGDRRWERVPGLIYRRGDTLVANPPAWPESLGISPRRDLVDNPTYYRRGGQMGVETKRGCGRPCIYCADPLAKGRSHRLRDPREVAEEIAGLCCRGMEVLHLCDPEFNLPPAHALAVCQELIRRGLGERVRWYAYLAVTPFFAELARSMRRAGCVGINFTSDSAHPGMLATYRQAHRQQDLAHAVRLCRENGIAVMLDMLLGGPGETPETAAESIRAFQELDPDCAGAALGVRIYPGTALAERIAAEGPWEKNSSIRRRYGGPVDLVEPTFYVSAALGETPGQLICDLIGGDRRFFPPRAEAEKREPDAGDHNYNDNQPLIAAIAAGQRGAYWDILRRLR